MEYDFRPIPFRRSIQILLDPTTGVDDDRFAGLLAANHVGRMRERGVVEVLQEHERFSLDLIPIVANWSERRTSDITEANIVPLPDDYQLANDVRQLELKHRREASTERFAVELAEVIERRYESS